MERGGARAAGVRTVGDLAAVLHLAHHIVDTLPVNGSFLGVHVVQVGLHKHHARAQVGLVELVRYVEAERPELAPLLHDGVHETKRVEHRLPLRLGHRVQHVLVDPSVGRLEPGAHTGRSLSR